MGMHWLDIIILTVIALSIITGVIRGFVKELIAITIWGLAIWLAYHYSPALDVYLVDWIPETSLRYLASFVIILLATLIAGGIMNALLALLLKKSGLSGTDRLLGMIFGFVRGVFVVALGLVVLQMTSLSKETQVKDSRLLVVFHPAVNWVSSRVPNLLAQMSAIEKPSQLSAAEVSFDTMDKTRNVIDNTLIIGNRESGNV